MFKIFFNEIMISKTDKITEKRTLNLFIHHIINFYLIAKSHTNDGTRDKQKI